MKQNKMKCIACWPAFRLQPLDCSKALQPRCKAAGTCAMQRDVHLFKTKPPQLIYCYSLCALVPVHVRIEWKPATAVNNPICFDKLRGGTLIANQLTGRPKAGKQYCSKSAIILGLNLAESYTLRKKLGKQTKQAVPQVVLTDPVRVRVQVRVRVRVRVRCARLRGSSSRPAANQQQTSSRPAANQQQTSSRPAAD